MSDVKAVSLQVVNATYHCPVRLRPVPIVLLSLILMKDWNLTLTMKVHDNYWPLHNKD